MQIAENIRMAVNSLLANKLRSLLTMLGIIIGIGSVIAIVTVGDSMTGSMNEELASFGGKNVTIGVQQRPAAASSSDSGASSASADAGTADAAYSASYAAGDYLEPTADDLLQPAMVADYEKVFSRQIAAISVDESVGSDTLTNGRNKAQAEIHGITPGYCTVGKFELTAGRWLRRKDLTDSRRIVLVSDTFVTAYWGRNAAPADAVGRYVTPVVNGQTVKLYVAGVYHEPKNGMYSYGQTTYKLLIPASLAKTLAGKPAGYNSITVQPLPEVDSAKFLRDTNTFFASYYLRNPKFTALASSNESFIKSMNNSMNTLKLGIGAIAAISLLVGGIGVMNIMMVSVTERTREIGVRMALGAKGRVILFQFIVEAMIICLVGGLIGVVLGVTGGSIGANAMHYPARPSIAAIAIAVGFSMAIGLFFGYYPAKKAARLDPIEALRYE